MRISSMIYMTLLICSQSFAFGIKSHAQDLDPYGRVIEQLVQLSTKGETSLSPYDYGDYGVYINSFIPAREIKALDGKPACWLSPFCNWNLQARYYRSIVPGFTYRVFLEIYVTGDFGNQEPISMCGIFDGQKSVPEQPRTIVGNEIAKNKWQSIEVGSFVAKEADGYVYFIHPYSGSIMAAQAKGQMGELPPFEVYLGDIKFVAVVEQGQEANFAAACSEKKNKMKRLGDIHAGYSKEILGAKLPESMNEFRFGFYGFPHLTYFGKGKYEQSYRERVADCLNDFYANSVMCIHSKAIEVNEFKHFLNLLDSHKIDVVADIVQPVKQWNWDELDKLLEPGWENRIMTQIAPIVQEYRGSSNLISYQIADEPGEECATAQLGVATLLHRVDPLHPATFAQVRFGNGMMNNMQVASYDPYPYNHFYPLGFPYYAWSPRVVEAFMKKMNRERRSDSVMWLVPYACSESEHGRLPAVSEFRLQSHLAVAYGARGIFYYIFSFDPGWVSRLNSNSSKPLVNRGVVDNYLQERTPIGNEIRLLGKKFHTIGNIIKDSQIITTDEYSVRSKEYVAGPDINKRKIVDVIVRRDAKQGVDYVFILNFDLVSEQNNTFMVAGKHNSYIDIYSLAESGASSILSCASGTVDITIPPGGCRVFVFGQKEQLEKIYKKAIGDLYAVERQRFISKIDLVKTTGLCDVSAPCKKLQQADIAIGVNDFNTPLILISQAYFELDNVCEKNQKYMLLKNKLQECKKSLSDCSDELQVAAISIVELKTLSDELTIVSRSYFELNGEFCKKNVENLKDKIDNIQSKVEKIRKELNCLQKD